LSKGICYSDIITAVAGDNQSPCSSHEEGQSASGCGPRKRSQQVSE